MSTDAAMRHEKPTSDGSVPIQVKLEARGSRGGPGGHGWLALATLCLAVLVAQLDTSVVNLAIHPIGAHFATDIAELQWVLDGYNLA
jgi:hypothetical protein